MHKCFQTSVTPTFKMNCFTPLLIYGFGCITDFSLIHTHTSSSCCNFSPNNFLGKTTNRFFILLLLFFSLPPKTSFSCHTKLQILKSMTSVFSIEKEIFLFYFFRCSLNNSHAPCHRQPRKWEQMKNVKAIPHSTNWWCTMR